MVLGAHRVYLGVFLAPLVTGLIIESSGYPTMWTFVAVMTAIGAALTLVVAGSF